MTVISAMELTQFAVDLFQAAGVPSGEAQLVAESLVESNLRGHDSHGVVRVPDYVVQLRKGELVAGVPLQTIRETPSLLTADAHFGFGQVQCVALIEQLISKARQQGLACGTMCNCGHVGRLGEWVERTAREGLAGLITVNDNGVLKCVSPPGGIGPRISTNPVAIAVPTSDGPLALDFSTSAVANGKVNVAYLAGEQCPPGWLQDAEGNPTTDPSVRFSDPRGTLLPMGGEQGYKGFGLALMLDILAGGLSGGWCPPAPESAVMTNNVLLVVWDPSQFSGQSHFLSEADKLIDYIRNTPRKPGVDAIRLPGDRGNALHRKHTAEGISLDDGTWRSLVELASELSIEVPGVSTTQ